MPWDLFCKDISSPSEASYVLWNGINFESISFVILTFVLLHLFTSVIWFFFEG
jgi:hypothetical protein